jgi:hypothetical protein
MLLSERVDPWVSSRREAYQRADDAYLHVGRNVYDQPVLTETRNNQSSHLTVKRD